MREIVREDRERPDSKSGTKHHLALALRAFFQGVVIIGLHLLVFWVFRQASRLVI
jgi:uncharacterized membrane protein YqjE